MTFKKLVREIARIEGKKKEVNIAQISEITKITLTILSNLPVSDLVGLFRPYETNQTQPESQPDLEEDLPGEGDYEV